MTYAFEVNDLVKRFGETTAPDGIAPVGRPGIVFPDEPTTGPDPSAPITSSGPGPRSPSAATTCQVSK